MMKRALPGLLLLCAGTLFGLDPNRTLTQYVHRIWTVQQGLPTGTIYDIWQTRDGFLWLGTQTGLFRFDGVRFTPAESVYSGLPENLWVRGGFEDASGAMWLGTNDYGILRIQNGAVTRFDTQEGLPAENVFCLLPGNSGDVWACTTNGLAHLKDGKIDVTHLNRGFAPDIAPDIVRAACLASDGTLWLGADQPEVLALRNGKLDSYPLRSIPADAGVRAIACGRDTLSIGTTAGLIQMQGSSQRLFRERDGLADDGVLSLLESAGGTLWIGTRSGFSRLRNGEFESFRPQEGLSQSSVFSLYEDQEGSLWVGTKHGLNQFLEGRAIPYTVNEGLPSNNAGPLMQDRSGGVWVGTLDSGLARFDGRRFVSIRASQGLASNRVLSLAEDSGGSLWVGTDKGLNRLRGGRVAALLTTQSGLPSNEIRSLYQDASGTLWIGTAAGIARWKNGAVTIPPNSPADAITALAGDRDGSPLFATDHGLFRIVNGAVTEIERGGMPLRGIDAIYRDPEGMVWLGTNGAGLRLLEESGRDIKAPVVLMRDGLFDSEIYGIVADDQDRLWMACSKGIYSVSRTELRRFVAGEIKKVVSSPYSPTDALRVIECKPGVQPRVWKMQDGRLWFSTIRGLIVINPTRLTRNVPPPPVAVEDPIVNGRSEPASRLGRLAPGQKNLEFNYTGLSFVAPTRITFRYILEGYDRQWIDAGTRREAYYTNLPPGNYRFRVTACNIDGLCNESGAAIPFTLAPAYYQRPWFIPALAGLAALAGWAIFRLRIRHLRERYDLIVAERSRIARELHDTLIQGFSGITMAMQALAGRLHSAEDRDRLEEIIRDAAACLKETRRSVAGLRRAPASDSSGLA